MQNFYSEFMYQLIVNNVRISCNSKRNDVGSNITTKVIDCFEERYQSKECYSFKKLALVARCDVSTIREYYLAYKQLREKKLVRHNDIAVFRTSSTDIQSEQVDEIVTIDSQQRINEKVMLEVECLREENTALKLEYTTYRELRERIETGLVERVESTLQSMNREIMRLNETNTKLLEQERDSQEKEDLRELLARQFTYQAEHINNLLNKQTIDDYNIEYYSKLNGEHNFVEYSMKLVPELIQQTKKSMTLALVLKTHIKQLNNEDANIDYKHYVKELQYLLQLITILKLEVDKMTIAKQK